MRRHLRVRDDERVRLIQPRGAHERSETPAAVTHVHADALQARLGDLVDGGPARLVANLPYNIATSVVLRALEAEAFNRLFVMVQREVGQRWAAGVDDPLYGAVSVKLAALGHVDVVGRVSRTAFYPVPRVDSVTVRLVPRPWAEPVPRERLFALVEAGFAQRRKRLRNALAGPGRPPTRVEDAFAAAGLDPLFGVLDQSDADVLQLNVIAFYALIGSAFSFSIPWWTYFLIVPPALAVMLIPISVNAIGIRENIFVYLLGLYGIAAPDAVAFAWTAFGLLLIHGVMGGVVYALGRS